jgi:hypothetical protein
VPLRKFAKIVESAMRDADQARRIKGDAGWNKAQQKDRRGTLRKFETVKDTIRERDAKTKTKAKKKTKKKS